jgi:hypothetical protein
MKAHQRLIRDRHAQEPDPLLEEKLALAESFNSASVREIPNSRAKTLILKYEWLGNMGCTDYSFGLYFGDHLAGVECFGRTAGTNTAASVCGDEYSRTVKVLCRGACVHWAHPHSASFLIPRACQLMREKGFHIFIAYSDAEAGKRLRTAPCGMNGTFIILFAKEISRDNLEPIELTALVPNGASE